MFANGAFPMGNNQQQGAQQPSGMGNGVMFPQVVMPPENQMDSEQPWFNPLESAAAGPDASNERMGQPPMDNLDPRMMMQPHNAPRPVDLNPEMQHWNEEMLQRNQHQFEGMTPEVFAASLNIAPDMAPQQSAEPEQQEKPQPPPPGATVLGMDFSDRGPAFTPPKPPTSGQDSSETVVAEGGLENVPLFPASPAVVHVEAPQDGGPPAVAPQEPSVAVHSQDIPQPPPV
uniref:Uncharacterized protein n=1 Tax=Plectus sambesii TaxID=2011161 RepID=A0A914VDF3_9BILA